MTREDIEAMLARYPELIEGAEASRSLGWYPSGGEVYKFSYKPTVQSVDRFGDYIFGGIGFEPDDYGLARSEFQLQHYGNKRPKITGERRTNFQQKFLVNAKRFTGIFRKEAPERLMDWVDFIREDFDFGMENLSASIDRYPVLANPSSFRFARRAIVVQEKLRQYNVEMPVTLAEVGGGHGRVVRDLMRLLPVQTVFYIDLPLNMILAARFLGHFHPGLINLVWSEADMPVKGKINIMAPWLINKIEMPIDLLVNFLSFQHMSIDALNYYGDRLIKPFARVLYHENRDRPREGFDMGAADYPFRDAFELLQSKPINSSIGSENKHLGVNLGELLVRKDAV